ncbi:MAG: hypothetical protein ACOYZ8_01095 [Chloroflexota bacterium]
MATAQPLWTGIPCEEGSFTLDGRYPYTLSADNHFLILGNRLVDLTTGEQQNLPIEGGIGSFSPDNKYYTYARWDNIYLFDLLTKENTILFEARCATYVSNPGGFSNICAKVGLPIWIDDTTLVYSGYIGDMPDMVEGLDPVEPNHTFVVSVDGSIQQDFPQGLNIVGKWGSTLVFNYFNSEDDGYQWLDATDLKNGVIAPYSFYGNYSFLVISPDGQYHLARIDNAWHLVELRTNQDIKIVRTGVENCSNPIWSPDQKFIACQTQEGSSYSTVIISLDGFRDRPLLEVSGSIHFPGKKVLAWLP